MSTESSPPADQPTRERWSVEKIGQGLDHPGRAIVAVVQALRGNAPRPSDAALANALVAARRGHERVCETAQREYDQAKAEAEENLRERDDFAEQLANMRVELRAAEQDRDRLRGALEVLAEPSNWNGNPEALDSYLYGHDTPFELARHALTTPPAGEELDA